jgi:hypothetical protein
VGRAFAFNIQGWNLTEASNTAMVNSLSIEGRISRLVQ